MLDNLKPQYQPWNEEEFTSDIFVRSMYPVQRWMYRTLLQSAFFCTTRPYVPNDDRLLWMMAGCESREQWEENKTVVLERFSVVEEHPELLENKRVLKDWDKLVGYRNKMREMGLRSAEVKRTLNPRSTQVQQEKLREVKVSKENESESEEENEMASLKQKLQAIVKSEVSDFMVKKFRDKYWEGGEGDKLDALRDFVCNNSDSDSKLADFLKIKPEESEAPTIVRAGIVQREDVTKLGSKVYILTEIHMNDKQIKGAASLLDRYSEDEIMRAFRHSYSKADDFGRKQLVHNFFTASGEMAILGIREEIARQEDQQRKIDALPCKPLLEAPAASEDDEWDGKPVEF